MENITEAITNKPAAEPVRKGATPNDCGNASELRGYYVEPFKYNGATYEVRPLSNVYASATAEQWDEYNAAVACVLTWAALDCSGNFDHDADEYNAARSVIAAMHRRAIAMRQAEPAENNAPRIDNAPKWSLVDIDRAPRSVALPRICDMLHGAAVWCDSLKDCMTLEDACAAFASARESLRVAKEERRAARRAAKRAANMNAAQSAIAALDAEQLEQLRAYLAAQANA